VYVTGYLNILKKELQGKDKLTAEIADYVKTFKVKLRLSIKLKIKIKITPDNPFNLEHSTF